MFLEVFNDTNACIDFDIQKSIFTLSRYNNHCFSGIGARYQNSFSALYILDGRLYFFIDGHSIDVTEGDIKYSYYHEDSGMTHFSIIKDGNECVKVSYSSWRMKGASEPAGFGMAEDDEEDFFAYIKLMLEAENRKRHLLKKYSEHKGQITG